MQQNCKSEKKLDSLQKATPGKKWIGSIQHSPELDKQQ